MCQSPYVMNGKAIPLPAKLHSMSTGNIPQTASRGLALLRLGEVRLAEVPEVHLLGELVVHFRHAQLPLGRRNLGLAEIDTYQYSQWILPDECESYIN